MKIISINNKKEKGFTLIEILIAVALLAIISAVVIPNVTGYLGRGESAAYKGDSRLIQGAVDAFYADPANKIGGKKGYPLKGTVNAEKTSGGTPVGDGTSWTSPVTVGTGYFFINFDALVTANLINDVPSSASADNKVGATGSYTWYVDANGKVQSKLASDRVTTGFVDGVYP